MKAKEINQEMAPHEDKHVIVKHETRVKLPTDKVWDFCVIHHADNHPKWDPNITLKVVTPGPIGIGTKMERINKRYSHPVVGSQEVTEYIANQLIVFKITEGGIVSLGGISVKSTEEGGTILTRFFEGPDEVYGKFRETIEQQLQKTGDTIVSLLEANQ